MNRPISLRILALSVFVGCIGTAQLAVPELTQVNDSMPTQSLEEVTDNVLSFVKHRQIPPNCHVTGTGTLDCNGYVAPNPGSPPDGWEPFEFKGRTYYFVPLAKAPEQYD